MFHLLGIWRGAGGEEVQGPVDGVEDALGKGKVFQDGRGGKQFVNVDRGTGFEKAVRPRMSVSAAQLETSDSLSIKRIMLDLHTRRSLSHQLGQHPIQLSVPALMHRLFPIHRPEP